MCGVNAKCGLVEGCATGELGRVAGEEHAFVGIEGCGGEPTLGEAGIEGPCGIRGEEECLVAAWRIGRKGNGEVECAERLRSRASLNDTKCGILAIVRVGEF